MRDGAGGRLAKIDLCAVSPGVSLCELLSGQPEPGRTFEKKALNDACLRAVLVECKQREMHT